MRWKDTFGLNTMHRVCTQTVRDALILEINLLNCEILWMQMILREKRSAMTVINLERGGEQEGDRERETWEKGQIQLTAFAKKWGGAAGWEWRKWITTLWKIRFLPIKFWEELWRGGPTIRRRHCTSHSGNWAKVAACNIFCFCFLLFWLKQTPILFFWLHICKSHLYGCY